MGIEPTMPLLAQSIIGFEDRGRHQSDARFRRRYHTGFCDRQGRPGVEATQNGGNTLVLQHMWRSRVIFALFA